MTSYGWTYQDGEFRMVAWTVPKNARELKANLYWGHMFDLAEGTDDVVSLNYAAWVRSQWRDPA